VSLLQGRIFINFIIIIIIIIIIINNNKNVMILSKQMTVIKKHGAMRTQIILWQALTKRREHRTVTTRFCCFINGKIKKELEKP